MAELNEKGVIEAALFISARPLSLEELRTVTGIGAFGYLRNVVVSLQEEYDKNGSALEIIEVDGKYLMRVRNEYIERVKQFAQEAELSRAALRTLAYISKHDGILKSEVVRRIGTQAYQDVKELTGAGFVRQQKTGRSSRLFLTGKFKKYFEQ